MKSVFCIMYIYTFYLIIIIYLGCNIVQEVNTSHNITINTVNNVTQSKSNTLKSVLELIRSLDVAITKTLRSLPMGEGKNLLNHMDLYNQAMKQFVEIASVTDTKHLMEAGEDVITEGGPVFLELNTNEDDLRKKFKWQEQDLNKMYNLRQEAVTIWTEFQKYLE